MMVAELNKWTKKPSTSQSSYDGYCPIASDIKIVFVAIAAMPVLDNAHTMRPERELRRAGSFPIDNSRREFPRNPNALIIRRSTIADMRLLFCCGSFQSMPYTFSAADVRVKPATDKVMAPRRLLV